MMDESLSPEDLARIDYVAYEAKQNFPMDDATARVVAEDIVEGGVPAASSEAVELERIARANASAPPQNSV